VLINYYYYFTYALDIAAHLPCCIFFWWASRVASTCSSAQRYTQTWRPAQTLSALQRVYISKAKVKVVNSEQRRINRALRPVALKKTENCVDLLKDW